MYLKLQSLITNIVAFIDGLVANIDIFLPEKNLMVNFLVNVDQLSGKNVIGAGGTILGEVKGAEVNPTNWQVTHLQVKLSSTASDTLGFKKRFRSSTVCMPVSLISAVGDVITIETDLNQLSQNPQITECAE